MQKKRDYISIACQYVDDILSGTIPACEYIKLACERFQRDLQRTDIYIDVADATRWCKNIERLKHVADKYAGQRFILEPWQVFAVVNVYGFKWADTHLRRFTETFFLIPRKNGKSTFMAPLAIGGLTWERLAGAEIYCGATSKEQSEKVYKPVRLMLNKAPQLRKQFNITVEKGAITKTDDESVIRKIIGKPGDGDYPSVHISDEYHEAKDDSQVATMRNGMGSRDQPLQHIITTAGDNVGGPCYEHQEMCIDILRQVIDDDSVFALIYTVDEEDQENWDQWEIFCKANPNHHLMNRRVIEADIKKARRSVVKQNDYKTKKLNMWVGSMAAYFNLLEVQKCRRRDLNLELFKGQKAFLGLDLSSTRDLTSLALLFPPNELTDKYTAFTFSFLPGDKIDDESGNKRFRQWAEKGYIELTEGPSIRYARIEEKIKELHKTFNIQAVPFDPYNATQLRQNMEDERFTMVEYKQDVKNYSEPMKSLDAWIADGKIQIEYNPVLFWAFGNVVARLDQKNNVFPNKDHKASEKKIDPVIALLMCVGLCLVEQPPTESIYEQRAKAKAANE